MEKYEGPKLIRSGLVLFGSRLLSVVTGFAFTLLVTRNTTKSEYGIWVNINMDIIAYFTLLASAIPFWVIRFVARKHEGAAKSGVVANLLLGVISTLIYAVSAPILILWMNVDVSYLTLYLIASAQIIQNYLLAVFQAFLRVTEIEALGYGLLIEEIAKIVSAYLLIVNFGLGLFGAMIALIFAYSIQILYYVYVGRKSLKGHVNWAYFREWFKGSLANIYNIIGMRVRSFDLIMLFVISGEVARAYYGAPYQIASIIGYSSFLVFALYPRLLMREDSRDVAESFKLFFMFAVPMTAGAIVLADSFLTILGEKRVAEGGTLGYVAATPILQLLALTVFITSVSQVIDSVIFGTEKFDLKAKIPFKKLVRSRIFIIFSLSYIISPVYLPFIYFMLKMLGNDPLNSAFYVVLTRLAVSIILLFVRVILARGNTIFHFPWRDVAKYLFAATVMSIVLAVVPHPRRISTTFMYTLIGGAVYFLILLLIDEGARALIQAIIGEVKSKIRDKTR